MFKRKAIRSTESVDKKMKREPLTIQQVAPQGLYYQRGFLSSSECRALIESIDKLPWDNTLKRRTQHYG
jgi:hypothetical protein